MSFDLSRLDPRVRTPMVSDSLDMIGIRNNVMDTSVRPLLEEMRAVGLAATIEFTPAEDFDQRDPYGAVIDFLDTLVKGEIAVVATGPSSHSAFWGELFSAAATGRGATGVVCDGPLRDIEAVKGLGFASFSAASRPIDYKGRMRVSSTRESIVCAGVEVNPGDVVVADSDGIVVIPKLHIEAVFTAANTRAQSERTVLKELLAGKSVRQVWDQYGVL